MFPMSINSISVLHTSSMISREVDPVEANPYKKLFYLSFDPSAEDDAATFLASFPEMKETSKIPFHLHLLLRFLRFVYIQINVLLRHIFLPLFFFLILFLLLLHPPPPCLCRLRKWSQLVVITTSISSSKLKFRR